MRVLGVLDLLAGRAVHARGGLRERYAPVDRFGGIPIEAGDALALARAYLDQLERNSGLPAARIAAVRTALTSAERQSGAARSGALTTLATSLDADLAAATDKGRVRRVIATVRDLANAR